MFLTKIRTNISFNLKQKPSHLPLDRVQHLANAQQRGYLIWYDASGIYYDTKSDYLALGCPGRILLKIQPKSDN